MEGTAGSRCRFGCDTVQVGTRVMAGGGGTLSLDTGGEKTPWAFGESLSERLGGLSVCLRPSVGAKLCARWWYLRVRFRPCYKLTMPS